MLEEGNIDAVKTDQSPIQRELMLSGESEPLLRMMIINYYKIYCVDYILCDSYCQ